MRLKKNIIKELTSILEGYNLALEERSYKTDNISKQITDNGIKATKEALNNVESLTKKDLDNYRNVLLNDKVILEMFLFSSLVLNKDKTLNIPFLLKHSSKENHKRIFKSNFLKTLNK